jgi:MoCo/4Fe-4S cofactor protein with predicted Tat translocation signal
MSDMNHNHTDTDQELEFKKSLRPQTSRDEKYWQSIEEYSKDEEFAKLAQTEFLSSPLSEDEANESEGGWARREFLKLMGASLAMATASCVRRPVQKIVPYSKQPEEVTLGVPNYYTSTYFDGSETLGVLVKTREGRPVKLEGHPDHVITQGGTSARSQAAILSLYDPERLKGPRKNLFNEKRTNKDTVNTTWDAADTAISEQLKKGGVAVLTGAMASPATRSVVSEFCQGFKADHYVWEPLAHDDVRAGQKASYGEDIVPVYHFDRAQMIVSIDADFLGTWLTPVTFTKQFSKTRKDFSKMSRLVVFDSNYSLTGANADIRIRIKPSLQLEAIMGLLHELIVVQGKSSFATNAQLKAALTAYAGAAKKLGMEAELLKRIANDLWDHRGKSLVVAGGLAASTSHSLSLQVAVNLLNSILENDGKTVEGGKGLAGLKGSNESLLELVKRMNKGEIKTLIIHRSNPIYALTENSGFAEALKKVEMVVCTSGRMDEIAQHAHYVLPDNHDFETWSDAEVAPGVYSLQQPTLRALYDTRSVQLSMMTWGYLAKQGPQRLLAYETFYDYLRNFWKEEIFPSHGKGQSFDAFWDRALQEGFVGQEKDASARSFKADSISQIKTAKPVAEGSFELVLYPTVQLGDGSQSNIAWLYELPDPVTKITWDNYVSVSLATATKLKVKDGSLMKLEVGKDSLVLPVHVQPGLHDEVMAVAVGYGRMMGGEVGKGVGQNAYQLAQVVNGNVVHSGLSVSASVQKGTYQLAQTQQHHSMEGRQIIVEATLRDYEKKKEKIIHRHPTWNIWSGHQYNGNKWGLAIDLNSCTGCSACMVACQSENNVPAIGKKYVIQGREMHWIRVDRYFTGTPENAETVFQPVMCQHCDNAPCETVCPVLATVHTDDGLNAMVYNRCVGTRYCANNCPYKVRRFNWFNYAKLIEKPMHMALNPDVTVRVRGVMEKCTFCVHRISQAKDKARQEDRKLRDGDVKTACQTACPTEAIVFGDMNDPESKLSKRFKDDRAYTLLEEWHAAPAVRYMAKIRNNGQESKTTDKHSKGEHA